MSYKSRAHAMRPLQRAVRVNTYVHIVKKNDSRVGLTGCANSQEVKSFLEGQKSSGGAHCGWKNSMISCPDVNN